jgi:hypothetical protein
MLGEVRLVSARIGFFAALLVAGACGEETPAARTLPPLPAGAVRVAGPNFHVDAAVAGPCATGASCAVWADLTALGDFKVNREYPFKFVPEPGGAIALASPARFEIGAEKTGRLSVSFTRPTTANRLAGTFKLSVCNKDECQVEDVALAVPLP